MIDKIILPGLLLIFCYSCKDKDDTGLLAEDRVLASYEDKKLFYSDVISHITEGLSSKDSQVMASNYIEKWLKDQIIIKEAKYQIADQSGINKITEAFRDDLLLLKFEEKLIQEKLDTFISDEELMAYYRSNKSRYKLESTIFRFIFLKANKPITDPKNLENLWKIQSPNNLQLLNLYCQNNAEICFLNPDRWYKWEEIKQYIPSNYLNESSIQEKSNRDFADFKYAYKIKFFEVVYPNQEPPLSFLRDQATQAILHQRKIGLLDKIKSELYEKELKNKKINLNNK